MSLLHRTFSSLSRGRRYQILNSIYSRSSFHSRSVYNPHNIWKYNISQSLFCSSSNTTKTSESSSSLNIDESDVESEIISETKLENEIENETETETENENENDTSLNESDFNFDFNDKSFADAMGNLGMDMNDMVDNNAEFPEISDPVPELKAVMNESISGELKQHVFQAETKQLLDIVSNSLYTDKEVFLRELLSNASDSMEKVRYEISRNSEGILTPEIPLEINIFTDKDKGQIIIQDYGIGMNEAELVENIGTIARSGSKAFVRSLADQRLASTMDSADTAAAAAADPTSTEDTFLSSSVGDHIIGQFGVGFYSVFMVSDNVEVYSMSAKADTAGTDTGTEPSTNTSGNGHYWRSDGTGAYSIASCADCTRGTKIVVNVKPALQSAFCDKYNIEGIIKKYSSYLEYPIKLNGSLVTSTGAIWAQKASEVSEQQYQEFYQLISNRYDTPYYTYHTHFETTKYTAQVLVYFPETHEEKFGAGRLKPGLNLYCKKVLVKRNSTEIVPDWLRFIKGAVDSENIPIHISRENMQDSALIQALQESLMMKVTDFLARKARADPPKYLRWYNEFAGFVKEGVCTDYKNRTRIAKLLRFETSLTPANDKISFEEYVAAMPDAQTEIFYLVAPNRASAMNSPYMEAFLDSGQQVLLCFSQIDEFCMKNLGQFKSKEIVGIEQSTAVSGDAKDADDDGKEGAEGAEGAEAAEAEKSAGAGADVGLSEDDCRRLGKWLKNKFPLHIEKVEPTPRLKKHPCVLVDHQSAAIRQYMSAMGEDVQTPPQRMQVNPKHNIIKGLYRMIEDKEENAMIVGRQLINNAFIAAGILDDPREMLIDMNCVMELALGFNEFTTQPTSAAAAAAPNQPRGKSVEAHYEEKVKEDQYRLEDEYGITEKDLQMDPLTADDTGTSTSTSTSASTGTADEAPLTSQVPKGDPYTFGIKNE